MGFENLTIEEIFGKLHTQECKKLFNHYTPSKSSYIVN